MKKLFKSKTGLLIITGALFLSCKNNDANTGKDSNGIDSTQITVDSVGPRADTINSDAETGADGAGTTGATGEGSTGSGSDGTTQKGNTSVRTDSTNAGKNNAKK